MTEGKVLVTLRNYEEMEERVHEICEKLDLNPEDRGRKVAPEKISFDVSSQEIEVEWEWAACNRGCCGSDGKWETLPLRYLWEDLEEVFQEVQEAREAKEKAEAEAKRKREEEAQALREQQEREQLARLKAKYDEVS